MTTNIFTEMSGLTGKEQEKFNEWLRQYNISAEVDSVFEEHPELLSAENETEDIDALQNLKNRKIVMPTPGQIRHLDRALTTSGDRLMAMLVLSQWCDQHWLIAPFAPYSIPATPGELATNIDFSHYAVIETWNAVVVPEIFLCTRTSFLRDVDEQLRKDACQIFFKQLEGTETPSELVDRIGPQINSEFDPRIQYLLSEKQELQPLRKTLQNAADFFQTLKLAKPVWQNSDAPMALAAKDKDDTASYWSVDNLDVVLKIFVEKSEVRLQVFASDRNSYSNRLDSWNVVSNSGVLLGTIVNGRCRIQQEKVSGMLCLSTPEGELISLKGIER